MTGRDRSLATLGGAAAGAFGGLFGIGGGVLIVPFLTTFFRRTQHEAHGTSLAVIGAVAIAGLVVYAIHGQVDWLTALLAGPSSALMARAGAAFASRLSTQRLKLAFSLMLMAIGIRLLWSAEIGPTPVESAPLVVRIALDLLIGAVAGFLAGLMGVGGGIIAVPAFTLLLGMSQQRAQGTSLALILFAAPAGAFEHSRRGNVVKSLVGWLALGAVAGTLTTSQLVQAAPGPTLTRAFAVFLLANAVPMAWRAVRGTERRA